MPLGTEHSGNQSTGFANDIGPEQMAVRVVDFLDTIHVHHQQGQRPARLSGIFEREFHRLIKTTFGREARKGIDTDQSCDFAVKVDVHLVGKCEAEYRVTDKNLFTVLQHSGARNRRTIDTCAIGGTKILQKIGCHLPPA